MNSLFDSFLRPPCRSDKEVTVTNPHTGVELRVGIRSGLEVVERILNDPTTEDYRRTLWNAGLRSRRPDGHGYLIVGRGRVMVPVNAEDPGPSFSFGDDREWDPIAEDRVYILNAQALADYAAADDIEDAAIMSRNGELMLPQQGKSLENWGPGWEPAFDSELLNAQHTARVAEWLVRHAASCLRLIPETKELVDRLESFGFPEWNGEAREELMKLLLAAKETARRASVRAEASDDLFGRSWSSRHASSTEAAECSTTARNRRTARVKSTTRALSFTRHDLLEEVVWQQKLPRECMLALIDYISNFVGRLYEEGDLGEGTPFLAVCDELTRRADNLSGELTAAVEAVKAGLRE